MYIYVVYYWKSLLKMNNIYSLFLERSVIAFRWHKSWSGLGHETVALLLSGLAINW